MEKEFNLIDEKWIWVIDPDGHRNEVGLRELLLHAHEYRDLAGETPAQDIALLRLVIAIVYTVFTRVDFSGEEAPLEDETDAVERWKALWDANRFPEKPINDYLNKWHERFWLFHPERPFYQVPSAKNGTKNTVSKLNGEVSESNNKTRLFSAISGAGKESMPYDESARWLLFMNGFDDCAAKQRDKSDGSRSTTIGWVGKLGLVSACGSNFLENILLNMPMLNHEGLCWDEDTSLPWELDTIRSKERQTIPMPQGLADLLTLQSRRILLERTNGSVTGYTLLGGDSFEDRNALGEPMTLWKKAEDPKEKTSYFRPKQHDRSRQVWRDFGTISENITESDRTRPGVVEWYNYLQTQGIIPVKRNIVLRTVCLRYDSSQSSSITDSFSDQLSFHADLLTNAGTSWRRRIIEQIEKAESAADAIGYLAIQLAKAAGADPDKCDSLSEPAKEQYYLSIDIPFRDWLASLSSDQDTDCKTLLTGQWEECAKQFARTVARQMVEDKGEPAYIGRTIEEGKKKIKKHYSSPEAYQRFLYRLNQIYPKQQESN